MPDPGLARALLEAFRAVDAEIQSALEDRGVDLSPGHARGILLVDRTGTRLSELAHRAQVTKQAMMQVLDDLETQSMGSPRLQRFAASILKVSDSYAPGLFHSYDVPDLPRTNNARESEFRDLKRRLIRTTGQKGAVKRLLLREGAWELIPGPSSQAETVAAISTVKLAELSQEQQRVHAHRARFRLHTRSTKRSEAQLKDLVRRWKALPLTHRPKRV
jgi:hypothetical protein